MWNNDAKIDVIKKLSDDRIKYIAIAMHTGADGDAIGSALALEKALNKINKKAEVIIHDKIDSRFYRLDNRLKRKTNCKMNIYDCVILVDCANQRRTAEFLLYLSNFIIIIDHHPKVENFANIHWCREEASTTILIYELLNDMNIKICKDIAQLLFLGICSDTGNFKYQNTNYVSFKVAAELIEKGADVNLTNEILESKSIEYMKLLNLVLPKFKVDKNYKIGYVDITREDIRKANASDKDASLIIDVIRNVEDVDIVFLFIEGTKNEIRIRARSKKTPINIMMKKFNGGGHENASGGIINNITMSNAIVNVLNYTKSFLDK